MTIGEFKAFIDGMDVDKSPTDSQWVRIMEKLGEVNIPPPVTPVKFEIPTDLGLPPFNPPYTVT